MVHPECPEEVVRAADSAGSTEQILRAVTDSAPGSSWAIGTEANMVRRLAANNPDKYVRVLSDAPPLCVTMGKIDLPHLLWVLDNLAEGRIVNRVTVPPDVAADARLALERMLALAPAAPAVNRTLD
jgi:quinolinate synthase